MAVKRGELGIMGTELNSELAKAMKVDAQRGAFVSRNAGSAAAKRALKPAMSSPPSTGKRSAASPRCVPVGTMPIGSKVELGLLRDGKPVTVTVELQQSNQTRLTPAPSSTGLKGRK